MGAKPDLNVLRARFIRAPVTKKHIPGSSVFVPEQKNTRKEAEAFLDGFREGYSAVLQDLGAKAVFGSSEVIVTR